MEQSNFLFRVDNKIYQFVKILGGDDSPTIVQDLVIGDMAGFDNLNVQGIFIPTEFNINAVPFAYPGLNLITSNLVKNLYISLKKDLELDRKVDNQKTITMSYNLPCIDLIYQPTLTHKPQFYELNYKLNLGASILHIANAFPALPANEYYAFVLYLSVK